MNFVGRKALMTFFCLLTGPLACLTVQNLPTDTGSTPTADADAGAAPLSEPDPGASTWTFPGPVSSAPIEVDASPPPKVRVPAPRPAPPKRPTGDWLYTDQNKIRRSDGSVWFGRGANLNDTRGCRACTYDPPNVAEVKRRADELIDKWHATYIRLLLESYETNPENRMVHWRGILDDESYFKDIQEIVAYITAKPGVYVQLSFWADATIDEEIGWPTLVTRSALRKLSKAFRDNPKVIYGVANEPTQNVEGEQDEQVWNLMNLAVEAVRAEEPIAGPHHLVAVQGTGGWARRLDYYIDHPIKAGGGYNIVYEVHVYDPPASFNQLFLEPAKFMPVIIGEFGPRNMILDDCKLLMDKAEAAQIPYLAWAFHQSCPPNLIQDQGGACGGAMPLEPTPWGRVVRDQWAPK